jgi:UDP-glucose 4-epimerase
LRETARCDTNTFIELTGRVFQNRRVLVTGGLGFIGSNVAVRLAEAGARVTVVDSAVPLCGANRHNVEGAGIEVLQADVSDEAAVGPALHGVEAIFNLAGEISHIRSMQNPPRDSELNAGSQLRFLEIVARRAPGVPVVYASTRQIYGVPQYLPVDERHPVRPVDFNGIHKYAATAYHLAWRELGRIDARVLCLTNVYGPRVALNIPGQGFLGHFIRRGLLGERIEIFGDGRQLRDPVYVDDVVDSFLLAAAVEHPASPVWNVGGKSALPLARIAETIACECGSPAPSFRPFPEDQKRIDIGSYTTDISKIRDDLGWQPGVDFEEGIRRTVAYFRKEWRHYLPGLAYIPQTIP